MNYVFSYRRRLFWTKIDVQGHTYNIEQDKMVLFLPDGGVQEVSSWRSCEIKLGQDWVVAQKKQLETQAGQPITLAVGS